MTASRAYWEKETNTHIFFWGGIFSNWYKSPFECTLGPDNTDYKQYNCVEQYFMVQKALVFGDFDTAREIMETENPREQKALGKTVRGYTDEVWNSLARDLVYPGVYAKFSQSEMLKSLLVATFPKILVEASRFDTKWGIGLGTDDISIEDPNNWRGTNWLGQLLCQARGDLIMGINSSFKEIDWSGWEWNPNEVE